ncbi:MAG: hypothetical protein WCI31_16200, partial [Prolixibacteraceae bacterium]
MTKVFYFWLVFYFSGLLVSCTSPSSDTIPGSSDLTVKWELVTNMHQGKNQLLAAFTIYNKSKMTLRNKGWAMFFSQ